MASTRFGQAARWALALIVLLAAASCAGEAATDELRSEKARLVPQPSSGETSALVAGNSAFAFDLYQGLCAAEQAEPGNLFFSPYSISLALAMTYAGARGETERQMAETLRFPLGQEQLHPTLNALDRALAQRASSVDAEEGRGFQLNVVNSLWGQAGYSFLPAYLDLLAEHYGAGLRTLDFAQAPEEARQTINSWVGEQTQERIQNLIRQGLITPETRLVLVNAIYFNAAWHHPFDEALTREGTFYLLDAASSGGTSIDVPMMRQVEYFPFAEGAGYQAIELPYVGREMAMVILLPDRGQLQAFEETLDAKRLEAILADMEHSNVRLTMPKFEYDASLELGQTLIEMGMPAAFGLGTADFSGMDGTRNLAIGEVVHKAFVAVDEAGTEAAAATAVMMLESAAPDQPLEVTVDRPFVFLIRDVQSGTILFLGRVLDPR
jgi:serpin B